MLMSLLYLSGVVRPVEHGLPLLPPALEIARIAVLANRRHVPRNRPPSPNLPRIVGASPAQVVAAVPLKPPAWILRMDPAVATPDCKRLRRVHTETVHAWIVSLGAQ